MQHSARGFVAAAEKEFSETQLRVGDHASVASGRSQKRRRVSVIRNYATGIAAKSRLQAMRSPAKNI